MTERKMYMNMTTLSVVLLAAGVLALVWLAAQYNLVVTLQEQAGRAWANVDVALGQRADLIPNLVATVRGYAAHERETLERVTALRAEARAARTSGARLAAEEEIGRLLPRVLVQAERYPELRASAAFLELQRELARLETVIADRRELYNAATTHVNILRRTFPTSLLARSVVPEALPLFQASPDARAVPAVRF